MKIYVFGQHKNEVEEFVDEYRKRIPECTIFHRSRYKEEGYSYRDIFSDILCHVEDVDIIFIIDNYYLDEIKTEEEPYKIFESFVEVYGSLKRIQVIKLINYLDFINSLSNNKK